MKPIGFLTFRGPWTNRLYMEACETFSQMAEQINNLKKIGINPTISMPVYDRVATLENFLYKEKRT